MQDLKDFSKISSGSPILKDKEAEVKQPIMKEIEARFGLLFGKVKVVGTRKLVQKKGKPLLVKNRGSSV